MLASSSYKYFFTVNDIETLLQLTIDASALQVVHTIHIFVIANVIDSSSLITENNINSAS